MPSSLGVSAGRTIASEVAAKPPSGVSYVNIAVPSVAASTAGFSSETEGKGDSL